MCASPGPLRKQNARCLRAASITLYSSDAVLDAESVQVAHDGLTSRLVMYKWIGAGKYTKDVPENVCNLHSDL
jgi:hypothetical protein